MKSPCLYLKTKVLGKIMMILFSRIITGMNYVQKRKFGDKPTRVFPNQNFPGSRVTRRKRV
jgi:hypothetical protein